MVARAIAFSNPCTNGQSVGDGRSLAYFSGNHSVWHDVAIAAEGTPFQQRVWNQLRQIPAGHTITYGELAEALGEAKAVRAVATRLMHIIQWRSPFPVIE
jgi:methylated-DNA-[protein]-cysteine S-methyltransferase